MICVIIASNGKFSERGTRIEPRFRGWSDGSSE